MTSIQCAAEGDGRLRVELLPRRRRRPHRRRSRGRSGSEQQASRGGDSSPQWHRKLPSSRPRATAPLRRGWSTPAGSTGGATASSWDQHRERIRFQKKKLSFFTNHLPSRRAGSVLSTVGDDLPGPPETPHVEGDPVDGSCKTEFIL